MDSKPRRLPFTVSSATSSYSSSSSPSSLGSSRLYGRSSVLNSDRLSRVTPLKPDLDHQVLNTEGESGRLHTFADPKCHFVFLKFCRVNNKNTSNMFINKGRIRLGSWDKFSLFMKTNVLFKINAVDWIIIFSPQESGFLCCHLTVCCSASWFQSSSLFG